MKFDGSLSVGDILQLVLAIAALLIAYYEFKRDKKERDKEKEEKKAMKELVDGITKLEDIKTACEEYKRKLEKYNNRLKELPLDKPQEWGADDLRAASAGLHDALELFNKLFERKVFDNYRNVYEDLLKNEERFSMSYGFSRYINGFRDFLSLEKMIKQISEEIAKLRDEKTDIGPNGLMSIWDSCYEFSREFLNKANVLIPLIDELGLKYSKQN